MIAFMLLQQMRMLLPDLGIRQIQIVAITFLVAIAATVWAFGLSSVIGYPLPFTFAAGSPMFMTVLISCVWTHWGKTVAQSPRLRQQLKQYFLVVVVQWALTLIYPIFNFVFLQVGSIGQTALAVALPVVKILMKYWLATLLENSSDLQPQFVIFNVEVFHALFLSCCMQNAISVWTSVVIMVLDALRGWLSIRGVKQRLNRLYKIDEEVINSQSTSVHCNLQDRHPPVYKPVCSPSTVPQRSSTGGQRDVRKSLHVSRLASRNTKGIHSDSVLPSPPTLLKSPSGLGQFHYKDVAPISKLPVVLTASQAAYLDNMELCQQVSFVQDVRTLLHMTEFLLLIEYVEVIIPVIYCVYLEVVYHLPNRIYYPQLRSMDDDRLALVVYNMLLYAGLELLSFAIMHWVLHGQVHFRPVQQLTFVLQMQWHTVQAKLVLWLVYMVQASLVDFGK